MESGTVRVVPVFDEALIGVLEACTRIIASMETNTGIVQERTRHCQCYLLYMDAIILMQASITYSNSPLGLALMPNFCIREIIEE